MSGLGTNGASPLAWKRARTDLEADPSTGLLGEPRWGGVVRSWPPTGPKFSECFHSGVKTGASTLFFITGHACAFTVHAFIMTCKQACAFTLTPTSRRFNLVGPSASAFLIRAPSTPTTSLPVTPVSVDSRVCLLAVRCRNSLYLRTTGLPVCTQEAS